MRFSILRSFKYFIDQNSGQYERCLPSASVMTAFWIICFQLFLGTKSVAWISSKWNLVPKHIARAPWNIVGAMTLDHVCSISLLMSGLLMDAADLIGSSISTNCDRFEVMAPLRPPHAMVNASSPAVSIPANS